MEKDRDMRDFYKKAEDVKRYREDTFCDDRECANCEGCKDGEDIVMKYGFRRKATASFKTTVNLDYEKDNDRFYDLMSGGINVFLAAMRINGKRLTPKNYKITIEVLKELSNGQVIIKTITPIRKHEEIYYSEVHPLKKASIDIEFSEEIKTLGTQKEILSNVKKIIKRLKHEKSEKRREIK